MSYSVPGTQPAPCRKGSEERFWDFLREGSATHLDWLGYKVVCGLGAGGTIDTLASGSCWFLFHVCGRVVETVEHF